VEQTGKAPCVLESEAPGKTYYMDVADGERTDGRARIQQAIDDCLTETIVPIKTNAPVTIGAFAFLDANDAVAVDLVNYQVDPPTDQLTPARGVTLIVHPPPDRRFVSPRATFISPDHRKAADPSAEPKPLTPWIYERVALEGRIQTDGALELAVPNFDVYCTVTAPTLAVEKSELQSKNRIFGAPDATVRLSHSVIAQLVAKRAAWPYE
jgi:hypothetical protein